MKRSLVLLVSCLLQTAWITAELFTAIVDLEGLLKTEEVLIETLKNCIDKQERKLDLLKKQMLHYAAEHDKANQDPTDYVSNPINAYLLIKRLTTDWKIVEESIKMDLHREVTDNLTRLKEDIEFPTDEDLNGAATALTRLQDTYNLDTGSLARGELNGIKCGTQLTSDDCFELGRQSYNNQDFYHTVLWMRAAIRKYDEGEKNELNIPKWEILEYLAYSEYMQGNIQIAFQLTEEWLTILPNHTQAIYNLEYYKSVLEEKEETKEKKDVDADKSDSMLDPLKDYFTVDEVAKYEMLCRGDVVLQPSELSKMRCRYVHKNNPFLLLAPLKEEEALLNPRIVLYRQVLYPSEIKTIKCIATSRLTRASVLGDGETGELITADYRIGKLAWLNDGEHPTVTRVLQRVEDITGLTIETAEGLQVLNYGLGGFYELHFDFARKKEINAFNSTGEGNRISTVLFYMTDVAQGGATVFPRLNLSLWPEQGTAAFWLNLHSSGSRDYRTGHAACPVLLGSKWVSSVWIHEKGQEFRRLCDPADADTADD